MLKIKNIDKSYHDLVVLKDFNLEIAQGCSYAVQGKSGIGKTTLFRIILGLEKLDKGVIEGLENLNISAVFQEDCLLEYLDVYSNIVISDIKNIKEKTVDEALEKVGLLECKHQLVCELSGGMKRRVAILRACLAQFDLLLLDEPFKGLDDDTKKQVIDYIKECTRNKTMMLITHDKKEIEFFNIPIEIINLN